MGEWYEDVKIITTSGMKINKWAEMNWYLLVLPQGYCIHVLKTIKRITKMTSLGRQIGKW